MKRHLIPILVLAAAAALPAAAHGGTAKDGDIRVAGTCSGASSAKLKLSGENGRIEVELEVDQNRSGVRWNVDLLRNGQRVASFARVTRGPSGSFTARRLVANGGGADTIRAVATRPGERCSARAVWPAGA